MTHAGDEHKWAVMFLRNAIVTLDTLNAIKLHLTGGAAASKKRAHTVMLNYYTVKSVKLAMIVAAENMDAFDLRIVASGLRETCQSLVTSAER